MFLSSRVQQEFHVSGASLIEFTTNKIEHQPDTDWIFFTSKNSVRSFFENDLTIKNSKLACIGPGTTSVLKEYCDAIQFIGSDIDIKKVGQSFALELGTANCLFPISNISKRSIQKAIRNESQVLDVVMYNTSLKTEIKVGPVDILIFTSPSNVRAYFSKYEIKENQQVIAMGPSTAETLEKSGVKQPLLPKIIGEIGLINLLGKL